MVPARAARSPEVGLLLSAGLAVVAGQNIEAAMREAQLVGRFGGSEPALPKGFEDMADEGDAVTME